MVRVAEWQALREVIPTDDIVLYVADQSKIVYPGDTEVEQEEVAALVECVDRGLTVNQIALEQKALRFHTIKKLVQLIDRGVVEIDRRAEPRGAEEQEMEAAELERAARGRAAGGDRSGALEMATAALDLNPESSSLQKLHRELERSVFAELLRDLLSTFSVPRLLKSKNELDKLDLTDNERYLAGRIDGRWDLLSLMRVSPLREVDALITFKRLADRGIIAL
jgi:hypothetical protein